MTTDIHDLLHQLQKAQANGNVEKMIELCQAILAIDNTHVQTHLILSQLYFQCKRYDQAIPHLKKCLRNYPQENSYLKQLALAHFNCHLYLESKKNILLFIERESPEHWCFHTLGLMAQQENLHSQAIDYFNQALTIDSQQVETHNNLAICLQNTQQTTLAIYHCEYALKLAPHCTEALFNLGVLHQHSGNLNKAIYYFEQANTTTNNENVIYHLAHALHEKGDLSQAISHYQRVLSLNPNHSNSLYALAIAYQKIHSNEKAEFYYQELLKSTPNSIEINLLLGHLKKKQNQLKAAQHYYLKISRLNSEHELWKFNYLNLFPSVLSSAQEAYHLVNKWQKNLTPIHLNTYLDDLIHSGTEYPLNLHYYFPEDKDLRMQYAKVFTIQQPSLSWKKKAVDKVGLVVTPEHEGIFLKLSRYLLENWHNKHFKLVIIAPQASLVKIKHFIQNPLIEYLPLPLNFRQALTTLKQAEFTFLYYWEIGTDSFNYFLAFFRLAPIQFTSWGIGMTSGISTIDYYLSNSYVEPDNGAKQYSEKLWLFKDAFPTTYDRSKLQTSFCNKEDFGFKSSWTLYIYPHNLRKLHPNFDPYLRAILEKDPNGHIVLLTAIPGLTQQLQKRLKETIKENYHRIHWLPRQTYQNYLNLLSVADTVLGSLFIGGGNVVYETLGLNQPMISHTGHAIKGRFAAACYQIMGLPELIASNQSTYVELALRMAHDKQWKQSMTQAIQEQKECLFSHQKSLQNWEHFLITSLKQKLE